MAGDEAVTSRGAPDVSNTLGFTFGSSIADQIAKSSGRREPRSWVGSGRFDSGPAIGCFRAMLPIRRALDLPGVCSRGDFHPRMSVDSRAR